MTSTGFNIGYDGSRASSKVLKPPGGGSSDIFGLGSASYDTKDDKLKSKQANTTQDRLFGNDNSVHTPVKANKNQSNIFNNQSEAPKSTKKKFVRRNPITGEEIEIEIDVENYQKSENKPRDDKIESGDTKNDSGDNESDIKVIDEKVINASSEPTQAPVRPIQTSIRVRNPPGGKSSGIF